MKKIILSTYDDIKNPHYGGGGARAMHEIAKRLIDSYAITIVSWNHSGNKHEVIDGVTYKRVGNKHINPKIGNLLFQLYLPFLTYKYTFDVWIESFGPPFTTSSLPKFTSKPVIGVVHMLSAEDMQRKYGVSLRWLETRGLQAYKTIIVTSAKLKQEVANRCSQSKIVVVGNGIDKVFSPKSKRRKAFLYVGRIEVNQKGLDLLIEAFAKFKATDKENMSLDIIGYGSPSEVKRLKELIKQSGFKKSIIFKGRVEGKEKERYYHNACALVVPSRFDTFSMVSLESLSHGTPVVAFNIPGLRWIPSKSCIKVKPFNTESFAKALHDISSNKSWYQNAQKIGIEYAQKHTWDVISTKYQRVIDSVQSYL